MAYIGQAPTAVALDGDDLANDIITLAKMASGTDGNIISYDASGNPVAIATGSDGQVLTSAGAGAPPAFEAAAAGLSLLSSVTISSDATVSFTGGFGGAHHHHVFIGSALVPATDAGTLTMVLSTDGGSSYASSGYEWLKYVVRDNTAVAAEVSASDSHLELTQNTGWGNVGAENWNFWIHMWFPEGTGATHYAGNAMGIESGGSSQMDQVGGSLTTTADTDAVRFLAESGAITSGKIDHYAWTD